MKFYNLRGDMTRIGCLIISLDREPRNQSLLVQLEMQGVRGEIVTAVDGRGWMIDEIDAALRSRDHFRTIMDREPTGPEVACAISHLECYRIAKERGYQELLVLEEDAEVCGDFGSAIERIISLREAPPTIITLFTEEKHGFRRGESLVARDFGETSPSFRRFFLPPSHTVAYLMNHSALDEMAQRRSVELTADWPPSSYGFEFWAQIPHPFRASTKGSVIEGSRVASMAKSPKKRHMPNVPFHLLDPRKILAYRALLGGLGPYIRNIFSPHLALYLSLFWERRLGKRKVRK